VWRRRRTSEWQTVARASLPLGKTVWEESSWMSGMKNASQRDWRGDKIMQQRKELQGMWKYVHNG
jgi:hypothetical protein